MKGITTVKRIVRILKREMKIAKNTVFNTVKIIKSEEEQIIAFWWTGRENNWGDALNPILIQGMTGKKPILSTEVLNIKKSDVYSVIGSILDIPSDKNLVIWGSGFRSKDSKFKNKPKKICAVRGPRTRELILKQGIECPEVYGDPAILYPYLYKSKVKKKYKLGVIPHYVDQNNPLLNIFKDDDTILIIDILSGTKKVVDDICSCEKIASSSLHGIIAADAYGIPSIWIEFSNKIDGNGFKFYDYFDSVGRTGESPLRITEDITIKEVIDYYRQYKIEINIEKLVETCPFLTNEKKESLNIKIKADNCLT
jgi:Polysaccharide pyruvyl transferase.